jgi:hypothetical protein
VVLFPLLLEMEQGINNYRKRKLRNNVTIKKGSYDQRRITGKDRSAELTASWLAVKS